MGAMRRGSSGARPLAPAVEGAGGEPKRRLSGLNPADLLGCAESHVSRETLSGGFKQVSPAG